MDYKSYLDILTSRPIPKDLSFSEDEYRARLKTVRKSLSDRGLDALLVTDVPNICYLTGYETFVPDNFVCLLVTHDGDPTLQVAEFEIPGALLYSWIKDIRPTKFNHPEAVSRSLSALLVEKKLDGKRVGLETQLLGLNVSLYKALTGALPNAAFDDASEIVFAARLIKSPAELAHMRKAAGIVQRSLAETLKAVRPGATDSEVAGVAYGALAREGSEFFSSQPMIAAAERTGWIHISQRGTRIKHGDTVMMELGAFIKRYLGALMHTAVIGEPSKDVLRLVKASHETLKLVEETVKPGLTAHEVACEVKKGLDGVSKDAYSTGMYGYSVGLSFPPNWQEGNFMIGEGLQTPMAPGMTFLTPITLRLPGTMGIGFTDIFLVTETGCEVLVPRDRSLAIIAA